MTDPSWQPFYRTMRDFYALACREVTHPFSSVYLFPCEFALLLDSPETTVLSSDQRYGQSYVSRAAARGFEFETITSEPFFTTRARRLKAIGL